ncbi:MAG: hypothetical protein ACRD41_00905 [Candidatus Acidiferrales bacterium]
MNDIKDPVETFKSSKTLPRVVCRITLLFLAVFCLDRSQQELAALTQEFAQLEHALRAMSLL